MFLAPQATWPLYYFCPGEFKAATFTVIRLSDMETMETIKVNTQSVCVTVRPHTDELCVCPLFPRLNLSSYFQFAADVLALSLNSFLVL